MNNASSVISDWFKCVHGTNTSACIDCSRYITMPFDVNKSGVTHIYRSPDFYPPGWTIEEIAEYEQG